MQGPPARRAAGRPAGRECRPGSEPRHSRTVCPSLPSALTSTSWDSAFSASCTPWPRARRRCVRRASLRTGNGGETSRGVLREIPPRREQRSGAPLRATGNRHCARSSSPRPCPVVGDFPTAGTPCGMPSSRPHWRKSGWTSRAGRSAPPARHRQGRSTGIGRCRSCEAIGMRIKPPTPFRFGVARLSKAPHGRGKSIELDQSRGQAGGGRSLRFGGR